MLRSVADSAMGLIRNTSKATKEILGIYDIDRFYDILYSTTPHTRSAMTALKNLEYYSETRKKQPDLEEEINQIEVRRDGFAKFLRDPNSLNASELTDYEKHTLERYRTSYNVLGCKISGIKSRISNANSKEVNSKNINRYLMAMEKIGEYQEIRDIVENSPHIKNHISLRNLVSKINNNITDITTLENEVFINDYFLLGLLPQDYVQNMYK